MSVLVRVASVNDDWATPHATNLPEVAPHVDLILAQECSPVSRRSPLRRRSRHRPHQGEAT